MKKMTSQKQKKQSGSLMNFSDGLELLKTTNASVHNRISKQYTDITKKIFYEQLDFLDGKCLKNVDISLEKGKVTRQTRRIVEKRMCQTWNKQFKGSSRKENGNFKRHSMIRATSYQLHNMGQVENDLERSASTHWKVSFDFTTQQYVLKKKCQYDTLDEARAAILKRMANSSDNRGELKAYQCRHCGHYHIGHSLSAPNIERSEITNCIA